MRDPGFPSNEITFRGRYYGVPPLVAAMVHSLDTIYGRAMDWRSRGWRPGDSSDPRLSYRGYEPALQRFAGGLMTPSAANMRGGLNQLLPGTTGLPGEPVGEPQAQLPGAPGAG